MKLRHSSIPYVTAWIAVLTLAGASRADEPTAGPRRLTFGSEVEVVNLNLSVSEPGDHFITDLKEDEIAVFEDGVPQKLCLFMRERLPLSLSILIDSSASMNPNLGVARAAALRLLQTLGPQDEAAIVEFNQRHHVLQEFTSERPLLEQALQQIQADGTTGLYNALYVSLRDVARRGTRGELRKRAVVVLSDGEDTSSLVTDDQVLELVRKSGVSVYTISLRAKRVDVASNQHRAAYFLTAVARDSGGRAYFPSSLADLDGVYDVVADELRTQYGVGYVSTNLKRDGSWRRIAIMVQRASLMVRHRPGYYAPRRSLLPFPSEGGEKTLTRAN
jgi:Ca-activated chloride channel family protein